MFIYILNLFMQMSQYLETRFQEMILSPTWNTGHILTSSNMRCKKDSKKNYIIMQILKPDISKLKFYIKGWEVIVWPLSETTHNRHIFITISDDNPA